MTEESSWKCVRALRICSTSHPSSSWLVPPAWVSESIHCLLISSSVKNHVSLSAPDLQFTDQCPIFPQWQQRRLLLSRSESRVISHLRLDLLSYDSGHSFVHDLGYQACVSWNEAHLGLGQPGSHQGLLLQSDTNCPLPGVNWRRVVFPGRGQHVLQRWFAAANVLMLVSARLRVSNQSVLKIITSKNLLLGVSLYVVISSPFCARIGATG